MKSESNPSALEELGGFKDGSALKSLRRPNRPEKLSVSLNTGNLSRNNAPSPYCFRAAYSTLRASPLESRRQRLMLFTHELHIDHIALFACY